MLSTVACSKRAARRLPVVVVARALSTEPAASHPTPDLPPPGLSPSSSKNAKYRLYPRPRPAVSHRHSPLPKLPPTFGRNQLLPVSNSTRALLESIVAKFDAPIRYAFAYGSGVFEQDGYAENKKEGKEGPMLDFMFAVTHPAHFHSINMQQFPSHYPLHARVFGSSYITRLQEISPGVWFNPYVTMNGVTIKYGVTTVDNLCADLLNWRTLYLAGRMHKPLRIIKDDARVRLTQQVNLTSAVRAALLTLPSNFSENELFERIAGISYTGDPWMLLPAENRGKVSNIVSKQGPQFKELYHRLVVALSGVHWSPNSSSVEQDISLKARSARTRKLPVGLLSRVKQNYEQKGDEQLSQILQQGAYSHSVPS
ncbi:hypothetical protein EST38_g519 [Candolleomyces aberdarensis]|uniref:Phosphatidate cytidylyltransferase, mitochondrial n=1 Tax=Candolleomyces aberdarensis TaxID=2316362 RepID=A0A4Q2DX84_9AGAR|nr:hypothetical protein EST38_g519 [Candolleomyces aberdarensis]